MSVTTLSFLTLLTSTVPVQTSAPWLFSRSLSFQEIERRLVYRAAFDLRQQTVADADDHEAQLGDVDGRDRHAFGIVARQDDAAGEAHQRGLVAQLDGDGSRPRSASRRSRRGGPTSARDVVGGIEAETGEAEAGHRPRARRRGSWDRPTSNPRNASCRSAIEAAGEDLKARLGGGAGGIVDPDAAEGGSRGLPPSALGVWVPVIGRTRRR